MSYSLVKRITFKPDGVYFAAASNNVTPKNYYSEKSRYHSDLLLNEGRASVVKSILLDFAQGNFKATGDNRRVNAYQDIVNKVKRTDEYNRLDNIYWEWDNITRTKEEKLQARDSICELLFNEYLNHMGAKEYSLN